MSLDAPASPFDEIIDRRGTLCSKWDAMEERYGVSPEEGISMWVADMDFRAPPVVADAVAKAQAHGVYGYIADDAPYRAAIQWWMAERHGWEIEPKWIFSTQGLVNAIALLFDTYTAPGDGIITCTPVYHAFGRIIHAAGRSPVELPLAMGANGRYALDIEAWDSQVPEGAKMMLLCSPHNPAGRVWTAEELDAIADFANRHDLLLVSDEIHHDLVFPGATHLPMATRPDIAERLIMLTAASKTFNIAGMHIGNVIIPDAALRARFAARMSALALSPASLAMAMVTAAYSPAGAAWVEDLIAYLDENRRIFDAAVADIPGLSSMPMEATYLAWVDFSGTGMAMEEFTDRVAKTAKIAANHGPTFGPGGESFLRFNLALPRTRLIEATERLAHAFSDLQ